LSCVQRKVEPQQRGDDGKRQKKGMILKSDRENHEKTSVSVRRVEETIQETQRKKETCLKKGGWGNAGEARQEERGGEPHRGRRQLGPGYKECVKKSILRGVTESRAAKN